MLIDIFNEIPWQSFQQLEAIKNLPLNEQKEKYEYYLSEIELARDYYYQYQVKGAPNGNTSTGGDYASCSSGMDVVFIIDYTLSMVGAITNIKNQVLSIVNTIIAESNGDYRLGLVIFDEYSGTYTSPNQIPYGTSTDYTDLPADQRIINQGTNHFQVLTTMEVMSNQNQSSFEDQLSVLSTPSFPIGNGDGADEPGDLASEEIVDNDFAGSFRNNVAKLCIIITDNKPGGDNDKYDQDTIDRLNQTATNASNDSIQFLVMSTQTPPITPDTGYRILSDNTGGIYTNSFTPTAIIQAIEDLCTDNA
jgi:hypothetical protein